MKLLFAVCMSAAFAMQNANADWFEFNGYYTGMSRQAVKEVGAGDCRYGAGDRLEGKDDIYCEIPPQNRNIGGHAASIALLEFKEPYQSVNRIILGFEAPVAAVERVLTPVYGLPESNEKAIYWERGGGETIYLNRRNKLLKHDRYPNYSIVTFEYDAKLAKSRQQRAITEEQAKIKREDILKNFWLDAAIPPKPPGYVVPRPPMPPSLPNLSPGQ